MTIILKLELKINLRHKEGTSLIAHWLGLCTSTVLFLVRELDPICHDV